MWTSHADNPADKPTGNPVDKGPRAAGQNTDPMYLTQDDELQQPPRALQPPPPPADQGALFDDPGWRKTPRHSPEDLRAEFAAQQGALSQAGGAGVERPGDRRRQRLQLLLAAESAGAMIAAEMQHTGVPWREELHERILADYLGPRPPLGHRPANWRPSPGSCGGCCNCARAEPGFPAGAHAGPAPERHRGEDDPAVGAERIQPPGDRTAPGLSRNSPACTPPTAGRGWTPG